MSANVLAIFVKVVEELLVQKIKNIFLKVPFNAIDKIYIL